MLFVCVCEKLQPYNDRSHLCGPWRTLSHTWLLWLRSTLVASASVAWNDFHYFSLISSSNEEQEDNTNYLE